MSSTSTLLTIGLPGAGKTTYLAALWQVLTAESLEDALRVVVLPDVRSYLNMIGNAWMQCEQQEHTKAGTEEAIPLQVEEPRSGNKADIVFPDLSGESFSSQWSHRQWSNGYYALAQRASGVMLFLHPDHKPAVATADAADLADLLADVQVATTAPEGGKADYVPYDDEHAPAQVKLIDILQFLIHGPLYHRHLPVNLLISAWDTVRGAEPELRPDKWLDSHMPMLSQFLRANSEIFSPQIFGISATGGDLDKERDRLLQEMDPHRRIEVVQLIGGRWRSHHDISAPIRRLLAARSA